MSKVEGALSDISLNDPEVGEIQEAPQGLNNVIHGELKDGPHVHGDSNERKGGIEEVVEEVKKVEEVEEVVTD